MKCLTTIPPDGALPDQPHLPTPVCTLFDQGTEELEPSSGTNTYTVDDIPCVCKGQVCTATTDCTCAGYNACITGKCATSCKGNPCLTNQDCDCNAGEPLTCLYWPGDPDHLTCQVRFGANLAMPALWVRWYQGAPDTATRSFGRRPSLPYLNPHRTTATTPPATWPSPTGLPSKCVCAT